MIECTHTTGGHELDLFHSESYLSVVEDWVQEIYWLWLRNIALKFMCSNAVNTWMHANTENKVHAVDINLVMEQ